MNLPEREEFFSCLNSIIMALKPIPFNCLAASVFGFVILSDRFPNNDFKLKTGNLLYKGNRVFTQNYSINSFLGKSSNTIRKDWEGHAWIEMEERIIIDLSLFDTVRSSRFILPIKNDIIQNYAKGRGTFMFDKFNPDPSFEYQVIDILSNEIIDAVNNGIIAQKSNFLND